MSDVAAGNRLAMERDSTPRTRGRSPFRVDLSRCRRYTSALLVVAGLAVGLVLWAVGTWWGLIVAVVAAFWFGAALARPWCRGGRVTVA